MNNELKSTTSRFQTAGEAVEFLKKECKNSYNEKDKGIIKLSNFEALTILDFLEVFIEDGEN
jgi:hypothetical protein